MLVGTDVASLRWWAVGVGSGILGEGSVGVVAGGIVRLGYCVADCR